MNPNAFKDWFFALFPLWFTGMWVGMCFVLSVIGGWRRLGTRYACPDPISGTTWQFRSAAMSSRPDAFFGFLRVSYGRCLKVIANENGLRLSIWFLFRLGHPPLFIPWSDILVSQERWFFFLKMVRFTFSQEPSVAMWIEIGLARKIQEAVGQNWFQEVS